MVEKESFQSILKEVREKNHALIEFPLSWKELKVVADNFIEFCQLQDKERFSAVHSEEPGGYIGYQRRDKIKGHHDTKEFFHYTDAVLDKIPELKSSKDPVIRKFVDSAKRVYEAAESTFISVLHCLSHEEPGIVSQFFRDGVNPRCYLRILKYDEVPVGSQIAAGHYDRGGLALSLAESAPGLRIWLNGAPVEVDHKDHHAVFMPGITFNEATKKLKLSKTWHDAVQKTPSYKPGTSRWAIVYFADPLSQRHVTAEEARTY